MAFPTIPTSAAGRIVSSANLSPAGTHTFPNLDTLTAPAGDLIIAIVIIYDGNSTNAEFSSWGASFTEFVDQATTTTMGIGAAYKWSSGSETGTFTVTSADTSTNDSVCILLSISGAHSSTAPVGGTITDGTSAAADIAALNPGTWDVEDTLWIAVCGSGEVSTTSTWTGVASAPANYTNYFDTGVTADVAGAVEGAVAFRQLAAASDDPGSFSVDLTNARNSALLIAVRPAAVTDAPAENAAATGTGQDATVAIEANAEGVAVTATAHDATVETGSAGTDAPAEAAAATATADNAVADIGANAEASTATASAQDATAELTANSEASAATATAQDAVADIGASAEAVAVTATANNATVAVEALAECATATAMAEDATVTTGGDVNAAAQAAEATAVAQDAIAALEAAVEAALASAVAQDATLAIEVMAEAAAAVATAQQPTIQGGEEPVGWGPPLTSATPPRLVHSTPSLLVVSSTDYVPEEAP